MVMVERRAGLTRLSWETVGEGGEERAVQPWAV